MEISEHEVSGRRRQPLSGAANRALPVAGALVAAAVAGASVVRSPAVGAAIVLLFFVAAVAAFYDVLGLALVLTGALPWLIVLSDKLPRLTVTVTAGAACVVLWRLARTDPTVCRHSALLRVGMACFFAPIAISLLRDGFSNGYDQAAKYVVFPLMVLTIAEATNRKDLVLVRNVALWNSGAAVTINLLVGLTGIANIGYYGHGEVLGLGSEHAVALLAGAVAAASLSGAITLRSVPLTGFSTVAAVATGVRSVLPGLALVALVRMLVGRVRLRVIALVAVAVVAIFVSGAAHVVESRYHHSVSSGEFQSFDALGSGRGEIYSTAVRAWAHSSPFDWLAGTGLRSILRIEQAQLGEQFVGHSDVVEVGVQLGIIGLLGLLIMWMVLIRYADARLPLFVVGSFAVFNGVLEYSGPVVIALLLTLAAVRRPTEEPERAGEPDAVVRRRAPRTAAAP